MNVTILAICSTVALLLIIILGYIINKKRSKPKEKIEEPINRPRNVNNRRNVLDRNRGARLRAAQRENDMQIPEEERETEVPDIGDMKIGAKKRAKLEAKAEKKAQREAEEHLRNEKKKKEKKLEEERKTVEEKEKLEQAKREAEEKRIREEKERKEHEEYLKMKEAFQVEEEGYEEGEEESQQNLLQEFVQYIKKEKVIVIENLAAHFKLKTQAVMDRLKDLQNDNILTGIIDDRGKFIYISQEEMETIAQFIRQRGRVSLSDIVENSNRLINLTPVS